MTKKNKVSKQVTAQTSTQIHKSSSTSNSTGKDRDAIIPSKDRSPDDLEILD
ncbi:hypothetical protein [Desulfosporosinus sp. OT]|uniref:hypothetical protein n=1 Tax=Desulfosporosinus sp. OT TaxID=913865 RepID=UPI000223B067|nr:hypothetical protein [Desulfosporosinus sp. OT]EGW39576.1 hypothetical protein DOT_2489 [Desulfosporosinus sp. OT]